jgi:hypothetical protein
MPRATEQPIAGARLRLQHSRAQIFVLAHQLKGDAPPPASSTRDGFPRSHVMRAITGDRGRVLVSAALLGVTLLRPRMAWRLARIGPLLRPLIARYLLPRFL